MEHLVGGHITLAFRYLAQLLAALRSQRLLGMPARLLRRCENLLGLPLTPDILREVTMALTPSRDVHSTLKIIMEKISQYYCPDTWSLLMVDQEKNELYFALAVGKAGKALKDVRLKLGEGIAGWVAKNDKHLIVPDVMIDPRFAKSIDQMIRLGTRYMICIPVRSKRRVLGLIQLVNTNEKSFDAQQLFCIEALCDYAAITIERTCSRQSSGSKVN